MNDNAPLTPLPFEEPWHAEVFALTTHLNESGIFSWGEWTARLGDALAASDEPINGSHDYYLIWLDTILNLLIDKGHASKNDVDAMKAQWLDAYERTPHGEPVSLDDKEINKS